MAAAAAAAGGQRAQTLSELVAKESESASSVKEPVAPTGPSDRFFLPVFAVLHSPNDLMAGDTGNVSEYALGEWKSGYARARGAMSSGTGTGTQTELQRKADRLYRAKALRYLGGGGTEEARFLNHIFYTETK